MNQNEIDAFLAVVECGSISAAARRLYIGQPTLSARIQALETELDATLFSRSRGQRSTELTQAGRSFEPCARCRTITMRASVWSNRERPTSALSQTCSSPER